MTGNCHGAVISMTDLSSLSDEQLLENGLADGEKIAELISRYTVLVFAAARKYSGTADYEELVSDGMHSLLSAVKNYDPERGPFAAFAGVCISNRMKTTAESAAKRTAHLAGEDELEVLADNSPSPEEIVLRKEASEEFHRDFTTLLTKLEQRCLNGVILGLSYSEIAKRLNIDKKSVDNAISRARAKLRKKHPDL